MEPMAADIKRTITPFTGKHRNKIKTARIGLRIMTPSAPAVHAQRQNVGSAPVMMAKP
ncbi:MAG: hypothetical protein HUJ63_10350 [Enterococcus sp.]|nr:hypothetical protein [Enterococcus sp.]